jgi:RNA polymerase sigma-70 factor (ECF subfamily)
MHSTGRVASAPASAPHLARGQPGCFGHKIGAIVQVEVMAGLDALDDGALLARTGQDPDAFGAFYRRHERDVLRFFLGAGCASEIAADLAAETFAAALLTLEGFREELGVPRAWLFGIARHLLARSREQRRVESRARRRLGMPALVLDDDAIERIDALASSDGRVMALLDELPGEQRSAVEARVVQEREYPEIAATLACSEQVVRKRVSRGLATLRRRLEGSR